jgi:hypothetical protein
MKGEIPEENGYQTRQQQHDLKFAGRHYAPNGENRQGIILKWVFNVPYSNMNLRV